MGRVEGVSCINRLELEAEKANKKCGLASMECAIWATSTLSRGHCSVQLLAHMLIINDIYKPHLRMTCLPRVMSGKAVYGRARQEVSRKQRTKLEIKNGKRGSCVLATTFEHASILEMKRDMFKYSELS